MNQLLRVKVTHSEEDVTDHTGNSLHRSLGLTALVMIGVGSTIGTGIFFTMAEAVPKAGPAVILSFIIAAITAGLTALCYSELAARIPASGSSYSYAYASVGEFLAFVVAACLLLEYGLAASATAIGWSGYLNNFLMNAFDLQIPVSLRSAMIVAGKGGLEIHWGSFNLPPVILVILCATLLIRGSRESATVNTIMVVIKLAVLVFFCVIAFHGFDLANFQPFFKTEDAHGLIGMKGVAAAAGTVFFSFIGLDTVATAGAEVKNPKRNIPLGIMLALLVVTVFYVFVALAAIGAQPAHLFEGQEAGLAVILQNVTGKHWPAMVLSAGAVISVFSVTLVTIYGQTRILFAISKDGLIPKAFQSVHGKTRTPITNTLWVCLVVALVSSLVDATYLWDMVSMGTLVAFIIVSISVPALRIRVPNDAENGFRIPFGPWLIPTLSVLSCLYIIIDLPAATYKVFAIWMTVAITVYFLYGRHKSLLNS